MCILKCWAQCKGEYPKRSKTPKELSEFRIIWKKYLPTTMGESQEELQWTMNGQVFDRHDR